MSAVADAKFCANCEMHNWKQPDDKSILKPCRRCKLIEYCSRVCRKEHWEKVHQNHCQFLTDPTKCPQSQHDAKSCANCLPAAGTGKSKQKMAGRDRKRNQGSLSYECFSKLTSFVPSLASPHPFPLAGEAGDLLEKSIIVAQKLVHKLEQNPRVAITCSEDLREMTLLLWSKRREIWRARKIYSHPKTVYMYLNLREIRDLYLNVSIKLSQGKAGKDASEIWKIVKVVIDIISEILTYHQLEALKNPIENIPEQFRDIVKLALDNKIEYLDIAEELIDSLSTQVLPYEDIVKKLRGGKKRQNCSFCEVKIEVTEYFGVDTERPSVLFDSLAIRKFFCGSEDCQRKWWDDKVQLCMAAATACNERRGTRCDFCFQLCPIDEAHRCCICLTVMYCSKSCHKKDKEEHKEKYCIEDERKTKEDRSMRMQRGEITPAKMAAMTAGCEYENLVDVKNKTLEAFQSKDSKSQNQGEDNPKTTEREHDTSIPAAATVPTAGDDKSESKTGAAHTENIKDRSTQVAGAVNTEH